jgi:hypothetical protein
VTLMGNCEMGNGREIGRIEGGKGNRFESGQRGEE